MRVHPPDGMRTPAGPSDTILTTCAARTSRLIIAAENRIVEPRVGSSGSGPPLATKTGTQWAGSYVSMGWCSERSSVDADQAIHACQRLPSADAGRHGWLGQRRPMITACCGFHFSSYKDHSGRSVASEAPNLTHTLITPLVETP